MTIQSVKVMSRGPVKVRNDGSLHGQILYLVTSDSVSENQVDIRNHASIPTPHSTAHPDNTGLLCRELDIDEFEGNDKKWVVTAQYDTRASAENIEHNYTNSVVEGGMRGITEDVPTFWDTDGNPIVDTADNFYEGLTKKKRLVVVDCTAYFNSVPWALFTELNGTINNAAVTIHGVSFPAGLCLLDAPHMPKRPSKASDGTLYWPVDFQVIISPDGWVSVLPNRGPLHYLYQTRSTTGSPWEDVGFDAYDAESDSTLKRRTKKFITDDGETEISSNLWLNDHGEKMLAGFDVINATCTTVAGSTAISSVSPALTAADEKKFVIISGAGHEGRKLRAQIVSQTGTGATLSITAKTAGSGLAMKGGGAYCNVFQIEDLADWSSLPLPNNHS